MDTDSNIELICQEHGLEIIQVKNDPTASNILYCKICMEQSYTTIEQLSLKLENLRLQKIKFLNDVQMKYEHEMANLSKYNIKFRETCLQQLEVINKSIKNVQESITQDIRVQIDELRQSKKQLTLAQVHTLIKELQTSPTITDNYKKRLEQLKIETSEKYQTLIQILLDFKLPQVNEEVIWQVQPNREQKCQSKVPEMSNQYEKKSYRNDANTSRCQAIALNHEENILATGSNSNIIIWKFDGQINFLQQLIKHTKLITSLCFNQNNLISSAQDLLICIWRQDINKEWKCQQILKGNHTNYINQIILNQQGDLLISCSLDNSINVWSKDTQDQWLCKQNLKHQLSVLFLSLSPSGKTLASCGLDGLRIWENDQTWKQSQSLEKHQNDKYLKACFANDNELFAFTKQNGQLICLKRNDRDSQFETKQYLSLQQISQENESELLYFPLLFNPQLKLIICRQSKQATFIVQQRQDGKYQVQQRLNGDYRAREITANGQYLILSESYEGQIEIWSLK